MTSAALPLSRIHHVAIICSDYERSKRFYTQTLGLRVIRETWRAERRSWKLDLEVGEYGQIELFSFPEAPPRPSYPEARGLRHLAFATDDLDACLSHFAPVCLFLPDRASARSGRSGRTLRHDS